MHSIWHQEVFWFFLKLYDVRDNVVQLILFVYICYVVETSIFCSQHNHKCHLHSIDHGYLIMQLLMNTFVHWKGIQVFVIHFPSHSFSFFLMTFITSQMFFLCYCWPLFTHNCPIKNYKYFCATTKMCHLIPTMSCTLSLSLHHVLQIFK